MRNLRTNYAVSIKTQAILSYPEKNLTKQLGVGNTRSEPTDYETEFREIADARQESGQGLSGPGGLALERRAGGLQREPSLNDRNTNQDGDQQNEDPSKTAQGLEARPAQTRDQALQLLQSLASNGFCLCSSRFA